MSLGQLGDVAAPSPWVRGFWLAEKAVPVLARQLWAWVRGQPGFGGGDGGDTGGRDLPLPRVLATKPMQAACISIRPTMFSWCLLLPHPWKSHETLPGCELGTS